MVLNTAAKDSDDLCISIPTRLNCKNFIHVGSKTEKLECEFRVNIFILNCVRDKLMNWIVVPILRFLCSKSSYTPQGQFTFQSKRSNLPIRGSLRLSFLIVIGLACLIKNSLGLEVHTDIPQTEMNALFDLYNATNGDRWHWTDNEGLTAGIPWDFVNASSNNPCVNNWQGIKCEFPSAHESNHVTSIVLSSHNLSGTLPTSLGTFAQLKELFLEKNQISGTIPTSLGNLSHLQRLNMNNNYFFGTIPGALKQLYELQYLDLFSNMLTGIVPDALGSLSQLQFLDIGENQLSGSIPSALGNLTQLQYLTLHSNQLVGIIPYTLGSLNQLLYLDLGDNKLTSTIPAIIANLHKLRELDLDTNQLKGTIPEALGNLRALKSILLYSNKLTGTIPDSFENLENLVSYDLEENYLYGALPAFLGNFSRLQNLYLAYNYFSGTIPTSFGILSRLIALSLYTNHLTGTIPEDLGDLSRLQFLDLGANCLTGGIPSSFGNLALVQDIYLNTNKLVGTIPASLCTLRLLQNLYLYINYFTGSIPEFLSELRTLKYLSAYANKFTGTIPKELGNLPRLQYLFLSDNQLTGTIPKLNNSELQDLELHNNILSGRIPTMTHSPLLQVLLLQNNRLTGNLDNVFDPIKQLLVATIVLSNNQLSGTLPEAIFQLMPQTFVGTSNCFIGPIPIATICNNTNMVSLVLDGISSASTCRNKLFAGSLSTTYILEHSVGGNLPLCFFNLPRITTLHLSGNGLTGSISSLVKLSSTLLDLSLSHNSLTGSIPQQIQLQKWSNIDVTYNRLSGTLLPNFGSNGSVGLENNRLSGAIPSQFQNLANVSVLGSNTFSCLLDQSDLPRYDDNKRQYHCGSNTFNIVYYIWLGTIIFVFVAWIQFKRQGNEFTRLLVITIGLWDSNQYNTLSSIFALSVHCTTWAIGILLPLYAISGLYYGTQTYKYAYLVSAVYTSGVVPFALKFSAWLIWLLVILVTVSRRNSKPSRPDVVQMHSLQKWLHIYAPYLLANCFVVVLANAAYVYVAVYGSNSLFVLVQILISLFKVVWGRWALPSILSALTERNNLGNMPVIAQVVVNVLNIIVIPCLVVAVVSPNCFYNTLVAPPEVSTTITYGSCALSGFLGKACKEYKSVYVTTTFHPPFSYSYQCSSSFVTYYSPAFINMCIVTTFVTPAVHYTRIWLHKRAANGSYWLNVLDRYLPEIIDEPIWEDTIGVDSLRVKSVELIVALIGTFAIVLTFGVMFPPLCIALVVSMFSTVADFIMIVDEKYRQQLTEVMRAEYTSVNTTHILKDSVWFLVTVSCWFYALFLFDILGDAVGFEKAYWVLFVMPLVPLAMYIMYSIVNICRTSRLNPPNLSYDIEMKERKTMDVGTDIHNILVVSVACEDSYVDQHNV